MATEESDSVQPVWTPPPNTVMDQYREHINRKFTQKLKNTQQLQRWTVHYQQEFYIDLYSYVGLVPPLPKTMTRAYDEKLPMRSVPPFFEGHLINYAENALFSNPNDDALALIGLREGQDLDGPEVERVTWAELRERVRTTASALRNSGIRKGDRVAIIVSNSVWAVVLFEATASIGAIFTSINPDLGAEGCVSRLLQVEPSILFAEGDATYKGRQTSIIPKIEYIIGKLNKKPNLFLIPVATKVSNSYKTVDEFLRLADPKAALRFERVPFSHPLLICYSSGTTKEPKCIVHQHGLILNVKKISMLHQSLGPGSVVMQFTTTTWVMFQIMMGHLSTGASTICYDGSPMYPDVRQLIRILAKFGVTYFGSSPRYLLELQLAGVIPKKEFNLSRLRMVNTTGASLSHEQYKYFYSSFPPSILLSNSAGGTDTATSLLASDPAGPLIPGEMQIMGLGMEIDILDPETGKSVRESGQAGEMVITKPFPSQPPFFWADPGNKKYMSSYFEQFPDLGVWAQADWLSHNPKTGGFVMHGRSDGVLNPSGIRFGSGEIYAVVEGPKFTSEVADTMCVGRRRPQDTDEAVFLFIKPMPGHSLTEDLKQRIRDAIRSDLSPRHVPKFILEVDELPVTINGKKVDIAVKQLISGKDIKVSSTVANPDVLLSYQRFRDVEQTPKSKL